MPNYNKASFPKDQIANEYKKVLYKEIYEFFKKISKEQLYINDKYLCDFVNALKKHKEEYSDDLYEEMKRRFIKNIELAE